MVLGSTTSGQLKIANAARPPESDLGPPLAAWLWRIWIELKDQQGTFSLKTFVGPTPTRQSLTVRAHGRHSPSVTVVLRGDSQRPLTSQCGLAEEEELRRDVLASVAQLMAAQVVVGKHGAFTTTDEEADGYYVVEWLSPPYLQGGAGGDMVCDAVYYNKVLRAKRWCNENDGHGGGTAARSARARRA